MTGGHWSYSEQVDSLTDTLANHTAMMATRESSGNSKKFKRSLTRNYVMKMRSWRSCYNYYMMNVMPWRS